MPQKVKSDADPAIAKDEPKADPKVELLPPALPNVRLKMSDLVPDAVNPRRGSVPDLVASLREFGQHRDLVVKLTDEGKYRILIGNHLYKAAQMLGWDALDCKIVNDDDLKAMRRALADNRVGDRAKWDDDELREVLKLAGDDIPGFDEKFLEGLFRDKEEASENEPLYPITPKFGESYHAVVIFSKNDTDWAFLQTVLELKRSRSYKNSNIGICHVVPAEKFGELWRKQHGDASEDSDTEQRQSSQSDHDEGDS